MDSWAIVGVAVAAAVFVAGLGLVLGLLAIRWPYFLLAVLAMVTPFGSTIVLPLPPPLDDLSSLVAAITVGAFAGHRMFSSRPGTRLGAAPAVWGALVGWAALTILWSVEPVSSLRGVAILLALVLLYVVVAITPASARDLRTFEIGIVVSGVLVATYAVYLAGTGALTGVVEQRFVASVGGSETDDVADPNITAASLLLPFFVAVSWGVHSHRVWRRAASFTVAGLVFVTIFLTGSRGGLLALLVGLVAIVWTSPHRKQAFLALALPVAGFFLATILAPDGVNERVGDSRSSGRTDIWRIAVMSCPRYCLQGSGWGTFPDVHEETLLSEPEAIGVQQRYEAHSIWIGTLIEGGVIALALLVLGLLLTWRMTGHLPRRAQATPRAALLATLLAASLLSTFAFKYFWLVLIYVALAGRVHGGALQQPDPDAPDRRERADAAAPA